MRSRRGRRTRLLVLLLVVAVAVPASASNHYDDISDPNVAAAAGRLADAGLTAGCEEGRFCPDGTLTRRQMALFLDRIAGRSWSDASVVDLVPATNDGLGGTPVTVTVEAGGVPGGQGTVVLQGTVTVLSEGDVSTCPCEVEAFVYRVRDDLKGPESWSQLPAATANGYAQVAVPVSWSVQIPSGTSETYAVGVFINGAAPGGTSAEAALSAIWTPYGG